MGDPLSPKAVKATMKRDGELIRLSRDPGEALRQWKRLKPQEQDTVLLYMQHLYDASFASDFKAAANKPGRPDLTIQITNTPDVTPDSLRAKGFRLKSSGSPEIWINASGMEIWRLQSPKTGPPPGSSVKQPVQPPIPVPVGPHPDTEEIRLAIQDLKPVRDQLVTDAGELKRLKGKVSADEWKRLVEKFEHDAEEYTAERNQKLEHINTQQGPWTDGELLERQKEYERFESATSLIYPNFYE
jgi:hypothetical protein